MIVEVINADGNSEYVFYDKIETLEVYAQSDSNPVPFVRVGLRSGRFILAQHDTLDTIKARIAAAKGGMPIHVQVIDVKTRADIGNIGQIAMPTRPPAPLPTPPNGQLKVPGVNSPPAPASPLTPQIGEQSSDGKSIWTGQSWADIESGALTVVSITPASAPSRPSKSKHTGNG